MTIITQDAANAQPEAAMEMRSKPNITVIDSIMGSGKTSWAIQYINDHPEKNFLYITPFLDEVGRVIESTKHRRPFHQPMNMGAGKLNSLSALLEAGKNIASTHELFRALNADCREKIQQHGYTLILDEVLDVLEPLTCKKSDIEMMKETKLISIDSNYRVSWNQHYKDYDGFLLDFKEMAEGNSLMCIDETLFVWQYDPNIFRLFDQAFIMTFMFNATIFRYYLDLNKLSYTIKSIECIISDDGILVYSIGPYKRPDLRGIRDKIHIYEGKLNERFPQTKTTFSKRWYLTSGNKDKFDIIRKNCYNFFRNINEAKCENVIWTTFKTAKTKTHCRGYSNAFIPCNCKATNDYADRTVCAYLINVYFNPIISRCFQYNGIEVNQDQYALSEMVQWIWRSAIRNGKDIYIYIPSNRMRSLLREWLYG